MVDFSRDAINNAIQNGIKEDIEVTLGNGRFRAAIILIYAGMDAMAYLDLPPEQTEVKGVDFIRWADRYVRFPCKSQVSGKDLYGARCGMLHAYGVRSRLSESGDCRLIGYMDKAIPEVVYRPSISQELVLVSVPGLKDAFFRAIDSFRVDAFADAAKANVVEERLKEFTHIFPRMNPEEGYKSGND